SRRRHTRFSRDWSSDVCSSDLSKRKGLEKHLFLPFYDLTSGETTYGGGRYLDVEIPESNKMIIDFNQAYNPYCAYSARYSCPIRSEERRVGKECRYRRVRRSEK